MTRRPSKPRPPVVHVATRRQARLKRERQEAGASGLAAMKALEAMPAEWMANWRAKIQEDGKPESHARTR